MRILLWAGRAALILATLTGVLSAQTSNEALEVMTFGEAPAYEVLDSLPGFPLVMAPRTPVTLLHGAPVRSVAYYVLPLGDRRPVVYLERIVAPASAYEDWRRRLTAELGAPTYTAKAKRRRAHHYWGGGETQALLECRKRELIIWRYDAALLHAKKNEPKTTTPTRQFGPDGARLLTPETQAAAADLNRALYPNYCQAAGFGGRVTLRLSVDAAGRISDWRVDASAHDLLTVSALTEALRLRFRPAGQPVCYVVLVGFK